MRFEGYKPRGEKETQQDKQSWASRVVHGLLESFSTLSVVLNGGLGFGNGTDKDNIAGKWVTYTTNAVANTEDTVAHNLGVVPVGFIVMIPPGSGTINKGTTSWTTTNIYLKCSAANQTAKLFLLIPQRTQI